MPEELDPPATPTARRFGDPDLDLYAGIPALLAGRGFSASAHAAVSDLQVEPYRGHPWLLLWLLLIVGSGAAACGSKLGHRVILAWALGTALLRVRSGDWLGAVGMLFIAGWFFLYTPGRRPGLRGPWRAKWVVAMALVGGLDLVLQQQVGRLARPLEAQPRVHVRDPVYPPAGEAWIGTATEGRLFLVPRGDRLVLEGARWARGQEVAIVPAREAIVVGETVFRRVRLEGEEAELAAGLLAERKATAIARFQRRFGRIRGEVTLFRIEDGLLLLADLRVDYRVVERRGIFRAGQD